MKKVIELAASERRLLLTEDKDFGQVVFAAAKESSSVILIRSPALQLERNPSVAGRSQRELRGSIATGLHNDETAGERARELGKQLHNRLSERRATGRQAIIPQQGPLAEARVAPLAPAGQKRALNAPDSPTRLRSFQVVSVIPVGCCRRTAQLLSHRLAALFGSRARPV